jgi:uncharacterized membrane protein YraQ (UPF0718 family)
MLSSISSDIWATLQQNLNDQLFEGERKYTEEFRKTASFAVIPAFIVGSAEGAVPSQNAADYLQHRVRSPVPTQSMKF